MVSPSSQTTQEETLGKPLFSFSPKKQLRKLCREIEGTWEAGRLNSDARNATLSRLTIGKRLRLLFK